MEKQQTFWQEYWDIIVSIPAILAGITYFNIESLNNAIVPFLESLLEMTHANLSLAISYLLIMLVIVTIRMFREKRNRILRFFVILSIGSSLIIFFTIMAFFASGGFI